MKDGILVVNKPAGMSSAGVVGRLKRILKVKKIGHTGTLDPFATGVLLIAIGKATKISRFFLDGSKGYRAQVTLGIETDTYDCTGRETARADIQTLSAITQDTVQKVVAGFSGVQEQVAPAYSALKHNGQPLYKLARQGKMIQKPPRRIEVFSIAMDNFSLSDQGLPTFEMDVHCSGGTYIRSLAFDIGRQLGCGGHLSALSRTRSSQFLLDQAVGLDEVDAMERSQIADRILSMSQCLNFLPAITADLGIASKVRYGQIFGIAGGEFLNEDYIRVIDKNDNLLAIVQVDQNRTGRTGMDKNESGKSDNSGQIFKYCCVFSS